MNSPDDNTLQVRLNQLVMCSLVPEHSSLPVFKLVQEGADMARFRRADVEVTVVLRQHVDVVEYVAVEVGERSCLDESSVHQ